MERAVVETAKGLWTETGATFFRSLVRQLSKALRADLVLVGTLQPGEERVRTLAAMASDAELPDFEGALAGTPGEKTIQYGSWSCAAGVHAMFPGDSRLAEMRAEGYAGAALLDSSGRRLGLIAAAARRPFENIESAEALLRIFAARAAAELERQDYEEALKRTEQRLQSFITHGNEAMVSPRPGSSHFSGYGRRRAGGALLPLHVCRRLQQSGSALVWLRGG